MDRNTNEKITDGARGLYEKATGYVLLFISRRWDLITWELC